MGQLQIAWAVGHAVVVVQETCDTVSYTHLDVYKRQILDEPTNHMDIQARETLESAFQAYQGTILFVSHDRYFIRQVADAILIFENQGVMYYPFGYEHYLERREKLASGESIPAQIKAEEQALSLIHI